MKLRSVHPFPARMAPSIVEHELSCAKERLCVMDPMCGSGSTLVMARQFGHQPIGFDVDPLAVLMSRCWVDDHDEEYVEQRLLALLDEVNFEKRTEDSEQRSESTNEFIKFWYDDESARQMQVLANWIKEEADPVAQTLLWTALSRMVIVKTGGVSRAIDVSHSRPHRKYATAPILPKQLFPISVRRVLRSLPFVGSSKPSYRAEVSLADARKVPVETASIDLILTSPPYLNAIDYMRGHRLSLVWMGYTVEELRSIRSGSIGTENGGRKQIQGPLSETEKAMFPAEEPNHRLRQMAAVYITDMTMVLSEISRTLKSGGKAVIVIGNCEQRGVAISNSGLLIQLVSRTDLGVSQLRERQIDPSRRYLPPPDSLTAGRHMQGRMRSEVILTLDKD